MNDPRSLISAAATAAETAVLATATAAAITTIHFIGAMIQRKDELFPEDNRFILDFNVKDSPEGPHLTVSSAPVNTELTKKIT